MKSSAPPVESVTSTSVVPAATKRIVNGQLIIERDGVRYNTLGAAL